MYGMCVRSRSTVLSGIFFKRAGTTLNDMQIKTWLPKKNVIMCGCVRMCVCVSVYGIVSLFKFKFKLLASFKRRKSHRSGMCVLAPRTFGLINIIMTRGGKKNLYG